MVLGNVFDYGFNARERRKWVTRQAAAVTPGSRVLDAGAGRGQYRPFFAHCEYKAQDFGQELGTLGHYTPLDYTCDITDIPVEDGHFDVVLCTEVLEHVPEPIEALRELARVLRPGGVLLCTAPQNAHLHQEPYIFYGGYTRYWYEHFCPKFGLTVHTLEKNRGFFSFFGQEALRFSALVDPRRTLKSGVWWPVLTGVWLLTLPFCRGLFPLVGRWLDKVGLESKATIGHHVVAIKGHDRMGQHG